MSDAKDRLVERVLSGGERSGGDLPVLPRLGAELVLVVMLMWRAGAGGVSISWWMGILCDRLGAKETGRGRGRADMGRDCERTWGAEAGRA